MNTKIKPQEINDIIDSYEASKIGLHLISPYVGKIRPALGRFLVDRYCKKDGWLWDPFCGSGTIPLEGWINKQKIIATDLNYYAYVLTLAKLFPPMNKEAALIKLEQINNYVISTLENTDENKQPQWVKDFFHPSTLKEIVSWCNFLHQKKEWFFLACLMGILHHQRPGFLSYPSSHGVPYLRDKKFPRDTFSKMYEYKNVYERLKAKVERTLKKFPDIDFTIERYAYQQSSISKLEKINHVNTIITSPPYMKALTYARDNRLRLWFLGIENWRSLEKIVSPGKTDFIMLMESSFKNWSRYQKKGDNCIIIVGDMLLNKNESMTDCLVNIGKVNKYKLIEILKDPIPKEKKLLKTKTGVKSENICIFQRS